MEEDPWWRATSLPSRSFSVSSRFEGASEGTDDWMRTLCERLQQTQWTDEELKTCVLVSNLHALAILHGSVRQVVAASIAAGLRTSHSVLNGASDAPLANAQDNALQNFATLNLA